MISRLLPLALGASIALTAATAPDARDIMRRSIEAGERNTELARRYVGTQRIQDREFDAEGKLKSTESKTYETLILEGRLARKLVAIDDRPLSADQQNKDRERLNKIAEERRKETPREKSKRLAAAAEAREKDKIFNRDILSAFDLRILAEERVDGRVAWLMEGTPHPGYKPKEMKSQILPHVKGKLWIDQQTFGWIKVDAEVIENVSFGLVLARMEKGSRFHFEQTRVNDEVWLPSMNQFHAAARVGLIKKLRIDQETTFRNWRKAEDAPRP